MQVKRLSHAVTKLGLSRALPFELDLTTMDVEPSSPTGQSAVARDQVRIHIPSIGLLCKFTYDSIDSSISYSNICENRKFPPTCFI